MAVLTVILSIAVLLLGVDNVRLRMEPNQNNNQGNGSGNGQQPQSGDGVIKGDRLWAVPDVSNSPYINTEPPTPSDGMTGPTQSINPPTTEPPANNQ